MNARDLLAAMHERARWMDPTYIGSDLHEQVKRELDAKNCNQCGRDLVPAWAREVQA